MIYCTVGKGGNPPEEYHFFQMKEGEVCVATRFFPVSRGLDSFVEMERMEECEFRVPIGDED